MLQVNVIIRTNVRKGDDDLKGEYIDEILKILNEANEQEIIDIYTFTKYYVQKESED